LEKCLECNNLFISGSLSYQRLSFCSRNCRINNRKKYIDEEKNKLKITLKPILSKIYGTEWKIWQNNNPEKFKESQKKWVKNNSDKLREYSREWVKNNPEKHNESVKKYRKTNPDKCKEASKKWQNNNLDKYKELQKKWRDNNPDKIRESKKNWIKNNPDKHRVSSKKHQDKRRNLESELINKWFVGSEGHHIDKENVIYVPKELHRSVFHNNFTGRNMNIINNLVFEWIEQNQPELIEEIHEEVTPII
jgi:hypothetical protein